MLKILHILLALALLILMIQPPTSVEFYNDNYFMEYDGTALSMVNALVNFKHNFSTEFDHNKEFKGEAIAYLGSTIIIVYISQYQVIF